MIKVNHILPPHSSKKIDVKSIITCKTTFVVYLLKCPCGLCYVGKTCCKTKGELKIRISEHKSNIRNKDVKSPVARHFNAVGHEVCALRFQGIGAIQPLKRGGDRNKFLLQREAWWILNLQMEHPKVIVRMLFMNYDILHVTSV